MQKVETFLMSAPDLRRKDRVRYRRTCIYLPNYVKAIVYSLHDDKEKAHEMLFTYWLLVVNHLGDEYTSERACECMEAVVLSSIGFRSDSGRGACKSDWLSKVSVDEFLGEVCDFKLLTAYLKGLISVFGLSYAKKELKKIIKSAQEDLRDASFSLSQGRSFSPRKSAVQRVIESRVIATLLSTELKRIKFVVS